MDQKTTSNGSGDGTKKNWRDRLGINKDLPKIAAEFKEERRPPPPPPPLRPAMPPSKSASGRIGAGSTQPISRPAPMAPRVGNGQAPKPAGSKPGAPPPLAKPPLAQAPKRPVAAEPMAKPKVAIPVVSSPPVPSPESKEAPAPQEQQSQEAVEAPPVPPVDDEFSARLRAQREAAERLASQRVGNSRQEAERQAAEAASEAKQAEEAAEKQAAAEAEAKVDSAQSEAADLDQVVEDAAEEAREAAAETAVATSNETDVKSEEVDKTTASPGSNEDEAERPSPAKSSKRPKFGFAPEELQKPDDSESDDVDLTTEAPAADAVTAPVAPQSALAAAVTTAAATVAAVAKPALSQTTQAQVPQAQAPQAKASTPQTPSRPLAPSPQPKPPAAAEPVIRQQPTRPAAPARDSQPGNPARGHGLAMPRGYPPGGQQPSAAPTAQAAIGAGAPPALRAPSRPADDAAYNPYAPPAARTAAASSLAQSQAQVAERSSTARPLDYIDDDLSEVFEDEQKPALARKRASAEDYSAAYRDFDDAFDNEEPQRNSGPMILILALLTVALLAGAVVYLYRTSTGTDTATPNTTDPVVIERSAEPTKVAPSGKEDPPATAQPASRRKQIYDRIQGETTLEPETILPSEEAPQLPSVTPTAPSTTEEGTSQSGSETEPLPLPLPPPPGSDQQGALPDNTGSANSGQTTARADQIEPAASTAVASTQPAQQTGSDSTDLTALVPAVPSVSATTESATKSAGDLVAALPLPEPPAPVGLPEPTAAVELAQPASTQAIVPPEPAPIANVNRPPKPRSRPTRLASLATNQNATTISRPASLPEPSQTTITPPATATGPIVLAPSPSATQVQAVQPTQPTQQQPTQQSGFKLPNFLQQAQSGTAQQAPRKLPSGRGDDDPLAGTRNSVNSTTPSIAAPQQVTSIQPQQVTPSVAQPTVAPKPAPSVLQQVAPTTPTAPAASGSGYVVQLASYRSEGEAQNEFQRLRSRHGGLIGGLSSRIQRAELGAAGTFYRLGVGPIGDKTSAKKLCNSLIAAGEKDCLVRRQ